MKYADLMNSLQQVGKDPSLLIFEDELTGIYNRRFLLHYLEHKVRWEQSSEDRLALLMMDLDDLKQINDAHGHLSGDQALLHLARLLREAAGQEGLPVRYAGDEFMILLPQSTKHMALEIGERLLKRCREEPLLLEQGPTTLRMTLSIGVASVPEDAQTAKSLIQRADAALYFAKKTGRNRMANAGEVRAKDVPQKAALQTLLASDKIVGRRSQLAEVNDSYERFNKGQTQFLLIDGAAGMGKTTFLDTVHKAIAKKEFSVVKVSGIQQEAFRPYYLAAKLVVALLNQHHGRAASVFESLSPRETAYLATVLPQLEGRQKSELGESESVRREGIFTTLVNFIAALVDFEPLMVLVDDIQFADEATLLLFRRLVLDQEVRLFLCGTSLEKGPSPSGQLIPLDRFYAAYHRDLAIKKIELKPLTIEDIHHFVLGLFPGVNSTMDFEQTLAKVSQGNPLILGEVLRKLVLDQRITVVGQEWVIQALEEGYLPKSLEEIVDQKISALDEAGQNLLAQASTFGEDMTLSVLTGSSKEMEAKVEEFVEKSVELGLLTSDFRGDDERIRFLGKRVLDIAYGGLDPNQKQALHERAGDYQETLHEQRALPSASYLAYHYGRSANEGKAKHYEELQKSENTRVFDGKEAIAYTGEAAVEVLSGPPLHPDTLAFLPSVLRGVITAVHNIKFYPPESMSIVNAIEQLTDMVNGILEKNEHVEILQTEKILLVNGQRIDMTDYKSVADRFVQFLSDVELGSIRFTKGLTQSEVQSFVAAFGHVKPSAMLETKFWKRFSLRHKLKHIDLRQVQYTEKALLKRSAANASRQGTIPERERLEQIQEIVRNLLGSTRKVKLYPLGSQSVKTSIGTMMEALTPFLAREESLSLSRAGTALLVNGKKVSAPEFKSVTDGCLKLLTDMGLRSLTFLSKVTRQEIEAFVGGFTEPMSVAGDAEYWKQFATRQNISGILFNDSIYSVGLDPKSVETDKKDLPGADVTLADEQAQKAFEEFLGRVPSRVQELLLKGDTESVGHTVEKMFESYTYLEPGNREKVFQTCRRVLEGVPIGFKPAWTKMSAEPLLQASMQEKDLHIFSSLTGLLHNMAENLVAFAEYLLATRIFSELLKQVREMEKSRDPRAQSLLKVLERKLDPKLQRVLVDDLKSTDQAKQQAVVQLLGSMGQLSLPMLTDVIKREEDLRARQIAAGLLAQLGSKAGKILKQELVLEVTAQGRFRILEVIDIVTRSLEAELAFALGDQNRQVRKAAFQLAERLNDAKVWALLMNYAENPDTALATGAIKCLGKLKPRGATEHLIGLLTSAKDTQRAVACCQALGQIADPDSIETLVRILAQKGLWFFGRRWSAQVRGASAFALQQIHPAQLAQVVRPLLKDKDARVRQMAKSLLEAPRKKDAGATPPPEKQESPTDGED